MDIENEIQVLRDQLAEKSSDSLHLLKEVCVSNSFKPNCSCCFVFLVKLMKFHNFPFNFQNYLVVLSVNWFLVTLLLLSFQLELHRSYEENDMPLYELKGLETLGSMLRIVVQDCAHVDFSNSSIQWFRIQPEGSKKEIISGWAIFILQSTNIFWRWYISDICCY